MFAHQFVQASKQENINALHLKSNWNPSVIVGFSSQGANNEDNISLLIKFAMIYCDRIVRSIPMPIRVLSRSYDPNRT